MRPYLDPGYPGVDFTATTLNGQSLDLRKTASGSKYVLLVFWGDFCPYCRREYESLRGLQSQYGRRGLTIIGINGDDSAAEAARAVALRGLNYMNVFNGGTWRTGIFGLYRVSGVPSTILLDSKLTIVAKGLRGQALEAKIAELLGPPGAAGNSPVPVAATIASAVRPVRPLPDKPNRRFLALQVAGMNERGNQAVVLLGVENLAQ